MNKLGSIALVLAVLGLAACSGQEPSTDPVVRGERFFVGLGCSKCHAVGDVGHDWGPDLTLIGFRKTPAWLDQWLKNPHAWNPKAVMPAFNLNDAARADVVAYLAAQKGQAWKNGYPWRSEHALSLPKTERGRMIFEKAGCVACHGQNGGGGYPNNNVAGGLIPSLVNVADGYSAGELKQRILHGAVPLPRDPRAEKPMIVMPAWESQLKPDEVEAVAAFLIGLKPKTAASKDDF